MKAKDRFKNEWADVFQLDDQSLSGISWKIDGNNKKKGAPCGWFTYPQGWVCEYNNKSIRVSRVCYYLHYGYIDSEKVVDHIDGDCSNNQKENLRLISRKANCQNKKLAKNSRTFVNGVFELHSFVATWSENTKSRSKSFPVKNYNTPEDAKKAAVSFRLNKIKELNQNGEDYTERHIETLLEQ